MKASKLDFLLLQNNQWNFCSGRSPNTTKLFPIPLLNTNPNVLISDNKSVQGWRTSKRMFHLQSIYALEIYTFRRTSLCFTINVSLLADSSIRQFLHVSPPQLYINNNRVHVDASYLSSTSYPASLKHHNMTPHYESIWYRAYLHDYLGLTKDTGTWSYTSEEKDQVPRPITGNALPSMALSTIKRNELGHPGRAKCRIMAW